MFETNILLLSGFTLGTALCVFLGVLLGRKPRAGAMERLALAAVSAVGLWHAVRAIALFHQINTGSTSGVFLGVLDQAAILGLALAPTLLVHLAVIWAGVWIWFAAPAYGAIPLAWWMLETGRSQGYAIWMAAALSATAALCLYAAKRRVAGRRHFFLAFAATLLAVPAAGWVEGPGSAAVVLASLAPPLCFACFVYRYNLFGFLIGRRVVFALKLGIVFAFYLFVVRQVARVVEEEFEAFGGLVELALIFAAALVWLPLYGWMTRFFSKRTQLYADFSKRLIEEAARILDPGKRIQFLAEEVGRSFALRRALLITSGELRLLGEFGPREHDHPPAWEKLRRIESLARTRRVDLVHVDSREHPDLGELLSGLGFNYLFPLWYEDHLTGVLLLDTSPRLFLDENEPILLGLSRQISHSIETCRLIDRQISLERALAKQEHLAGLGKVAATIAHELKNPLSSIKTLAQLMREDREVEQRYARDLSYIIGEADRLNRSVQQLLQFSRPAPDLEGEVDLSELVEATAEVLARQHAAERIRVEKRITPQLRLKRANIEILKQIVLNLALNAIQASEANGAVQLEVGAENGGIRISVSDCGPGIPVELREKIFEPFFTTKQKGTGLGLAIVRKNVHHLRGEIHVESPVAGKRGTRVTVILPAE